MASSMNVYRLAWYGADGRQHWQAARAPGHMAAVRAVFPGVRFFPGNVEPPRGGGRVLSFAVDPYSPEQGGIHGKVWVRELVGSEADQAADYLRTQSRRSIRRTESNPASGMSWADGWRAGHADRLLGRSSMVSRTSPSPEYRAGYVAGNEGRPAEPPTQARRAAMKATARGTMGNPPGRSRIRTAAEQGAITSGRADHPRPITRQTWERLSRDRKTVLGGVPYVLTLDKATGGTILEPVRIVENPPSESVRYEHTALGEQALVPGTPRRTMPTGKVRRPGSKGTEGLPLFGQDEPRQEGLFGNPLTRDEARQVMGAARYSYRQMRRPTGLTAPQLRDRDTTVAYAAFHAGQLAALLDALREFRHGGPQGKRGRGWRPSLPAVVGEAAARSQAWRERAGYRNPLTHAEVAGIRARASALDRSADTLTGAERGYRIGQAFEGEFLARAYGPGGPWRHTSHGGLSGNPPRDVHPTEHAYMIGWYDGARGQGRAPVAAYQEWQNGALSEWYLAGVRDGRSGAWGRVRKIARAFPQHVLRVGPRLDDAPRSTVGASVFARWYAEHRAPPRSNPPRGRRLLAAMNTYYAGNPGVREAWAAYRTGRAVQRLRREGVRLNPRAEREPIHVDVIVGPGATHNPTRSVSPVLIYDKALAVVAQKGRDSQYPGERFVHRFTSAPHILGMPDGTLAIVPRGRRP